MRGCWDVQPRHRDGGPWRKRVLKNCPIRKPYRSPSPYKTCSDPVWEICIGTVVGDYMRDLYGSSGGRLYGSCGGSCGGRLYERFVWEIV